MLKPIAFGGVLLNKAIFFGIISPKAISRQDIISDMIKITTIILCSANEVSLKKVYR